MPDLYNVNDGLTGRDGGPYLDQVEQERAEIIRAKKEGREPDLDNPGGAAGTVYVTAEQLLANRTDTYTPGQSTKDKSAAKVALDALVEDSDSNLKVAFVAPDVPDEDKDESNEASESDEQITAGSDYKVTTFESNSESKE